jgi:hypothetical protein
MMNPLPSSNVSVVKDHITYVVVLNHVINLPLIRIAVYTQLVILQDSLLDSVVEVSLGLAQQSGGFRKTNGESNKRIIDNKPFTFNPTSKRWEPGTTPESGQQQLPAANVAPATTPSATHPPVPPSPTTLPALPIMQGAFFNNGYGNPSPDNKEAEKQAIAQQMIQLKQVWESM